MSKPRAENLPPELKRTPSGDTDVNSLADLLEWFLTYDERTARIRLRDVEEVFQWKQADDAANGEEVYPFENAEARFAIGALQALAENNTEPLLRSWISDVLNALQEARQIRGEMAESYKLDRDPGASTIQKAERLTTNSEKRVFLTSCWREALCIAEVRFLGWVYQELYGKPFAP